MKNSTYVVRKPFWLSVAFLLFLSSLHAQLTPKNLTAANGELVGFYEYKPVDYNPAIKYPIIIFLHGIGERGNGTTDLPRILGNGTPNEIQNGHNMRFFWNGKWETFLVLMPQLNSKYGYWQNFYVDEMLKYAENNLSIDPNRIYLTGLSLGGGGVWAYAAGSAANAQKFAAIGVTCGTCQNVNWCHVANANLPVWAWHAQDDGTVGVSCSIGAVSGIENCNPAVRPYLTVWPTGQHWIWTRVYNTAYEAQHPNIYEWFLGQDKSKPVNQRPVAHAGSDKTITTGLGVVTLDASGSTDADGKIVRYVWTQTSGPTQTQLPNGGVLTTPLATITGFTVPGTYKFELRVIDDRADWTTASVTVTVTSGPAPSNQRPVADAGDDITIILPANAELDGSQSYDPDGSISSYSWSYVSGPLQYTLHTPTSAKTTLSDLEPGTYVFRLVVTDNGGLTHEDQVMVNVLPPGSAPPANRPPVASAGTDIVVALPNNSTTLDGSASLDLDNNIASYAWTKISGPASYNIANAAAAKTGVSNLSAGTYQFRLLVTDKEGLTSSDTVTVSVKTISNPSNQPAVPEAGNTIHVTLPDNTVILDGTGSYDPDGALNQFEWSLSAGPAQYTILNKNAVKTAVSNLIQGTYIFRLVVWDNAWVPVADTVRVVVHPAPTGANRPPVANAGNDITIKLPTNNTPLNGSASDPDNNISSYLWKKISGPAAYQIADAGSLQTTVSNLEEGTYAFSLTVTDAGGLSHADTVVVTVQAADPAPPNQQPVARAGNDITIKLPVNYTKLDGSASSDPDGNIVSYKWTKLTGPAAYTIAKPDSAATDLTGLEEGKYTFRLVVTDNGGLTGDDTIQVTVQAADPAPNQKPVAKAGNDITIKLPVNYTRLNGSASSDPDGNIVSYKWTKLTGPAAYTIAKPDSAATDLTGLEEGKYTFRLVVTDNGGLTDDDTVQVTVQAADPAPNQKPVAKAGNDTSITLPVNSIKLDGSASFDPDGGAINRFQWTKIGGPAAFAITNSTAAATTVTGMEEGKYSFRLVVTDDGGLTDDDTIIVTVQPKPNVAPVANAGDDREVAATTTQIKLDGTGSYDPDGDIESYLWVRVKGPGSVTIGNSNTATPTVYNAGEGEHVFELTVTDDQGASAKDQVVITVLSSNSTRPVANAGRDTGISVPASSAVLDGRASFDPDGSIVKYEWRQIEGPTVAVLANKYGSVTVVNELEVGEYAFELTVTDNVGVTDTDTVRVMVFNNLHYQEELTIFPNPAYASTLNIRFISDSVGTARITVYDMQGRAVLITHVEKQLSWLEYPLNIAPLKKGVYYLEIMVDNKKRTITQFIKR